MSKKKGNKENDIILSCVGGSRDGITGSCWLASYPIGNEQRKLLVIECGMIQGNMKPEHEYSDNKKMIENVPVSEATNVFLSHPHCDHSSNTQIFNEKNGFYGMVISSEEALPITQDLLKDSTHLHEILIKTLQSLGKKPKPLYTNEDMYDMFDKMRCADKHKIHKLDEWVSYQFY
jgi:Cft2 family RNA processing exonuclease